MSALKNPVKAALRQSIKAVLKKLPAENKQSQSRAVVDKILSSTAFKNSNRISIYLSTADEVDTTDILREMFRQGKIVFVPTYQGDLMEMVRLNGMADYSALPTTKWCIKQPSFDDNREDAIETGGLDLFLIPGVAFTREGGRLGHGKGYYDKYFKRYFDKFPEKLATGVDVEVKLPANKTILIGLAFKEQIVDRNELQLDPHDFILHRVITSD